MYQPLPARSQPPPLDDPQGARLKDLLSLLGAFEGTRETHLASVAVAVERAVRGLETEPLPPISVDRLQDNQLRTGNAQGFVEDRLGVGAVVQSQGDDGDVERGVTKALST
jgi:hypothetical protein